ncbi:MAG: DUF3311 domain-containing protein [Acidilobus sp.]
MQIGCDYGKAHDGGESSHSGPPAHTRRVLHGYPAYNYASPELLGVPFFYWFQTLWLAISAVLFTAAAVIWERGLSREEKR